MSEDIASIGFKADTTDIERGTVALEVLASKGAKIDKSSTTISNAVKHKGA